MKIGFSVEDATSEAFLTGLRARWCPEAELVKGHSRGSTGESLRREIPKICQELDDKGCDVIVILTDSNRRAWREVHKEQLDRVPAKFVHRILSGVSERNIECWLCADADWIARETCRSPNGYRVDDPKGVFEHAMGISSHNRQEKRIAGLVENAPMDRWLDGSPSFARFHDDALKLAQSSGCAMPNESQRARHRGRA